MNTENKDSFESFFQNELKVAKNARDVKVNKIKTWMNEYEGELYGNETDGKSKMVWKLIKKQGESLKSNLVKPFLSSYQIIEGEPLTDRDAYKTIIYEKLINFFFSKKLNKSKFMKALASTIIKEGTAFIRVGWKRETKTNTQELGMEVPPEFIEKLQSQGAKISQKEDGMIVASFTKVIKNEPTAVICKNDRVYTDPEADSIENSKYLIYEYETTASELAQQSHLYDKDTIRLLTGIGEAGVSDDDDILRPNSDKVNYKDNPRKTLKIYEYWGKYDLDGDGIVEEVYGVLAKSHTQEGDVSFKKLKLKKNPFSFQKIPFISVNLYDVEHEIWGDSLSALISDEQKLMTSIIRGIIENIGNSTNGQTFIKANALDSMNYNKFLNGDPLIELNVNENIANAIYQGNFNELPQSVYNLLNMIETNSESLTGLNRMMQGLPGSELNASTNNFNQMMSLSQTRLLDATTNVMGGLKSVFDMWISMAMTYLSDDEIEIYTGINIPELKVKTTKELEAKFGIEEVPEDVGAKMQMLIIKEVNDIFDRNNYNIDVVIKIGTDALKQMKLQNVNMMFDRVSQTIGLGALPPAALRLPLTELAENTDQLALAKYIKEYRDPAPSENQQKMEEISVMAAMAAAKKDEGLALNALARTKLTDAKTALEHASADSHVAKKYTDISNSIKDRDLKEKDLNIREEDAVTKRLSAHNQRAQIDKNGEKNE
jgi:hypothetical protein